MSFLRWVMKANSVPNGAENIITLITFYFLRNYF